MKLHNQIIEGAYLLEPNTFEDNRGSFRRSFCLETLKDNGINFNVCQGNISENKHKFTMRGFHYQKHPSKETKILAPISGSIHNVLIDLRRSSPSFLKTMAIQISSSDRTSLLVPAGCANAFLTLEENTVVHYYMGDFFKPESYTGFRHDDPFFNIQWPHSIEVISEKDISYPNFSIGNL